MKPLIVLGIQGDVEYAKDYKEQLWYRFTSEHLNSDKIWKLVAR